MGLGNKKSTDIFNKKTGGDTDSKSISTSKETEIKNKFDNGEHVEDTGMFETLAPALYAIQQLTEDVEELRRYLTDDVGDGAKGDTGATGARGATGAKGDKGDTGAAGADGAAGTTDASKLDASTLPTSKPKTKNKLWNNRGVVNVS